MSTNNNVFFSLSFCLGYFSPIRGCPRVPKLWLAPNSQKYYDSFLKTNLNPTFPLHYAIFWQTKGLFSKIVLGFRNFVYDFWVAMGDVADTCADEFPMGLMGGRAGVPIGKNKRSCAILWEIMCSFWYGGSWVFWHTCSELKMIGWSTQNMSSLYKVKKNLRVYDLLWPSY